MYAATLDDLLAVEVPTDYVMYNQSLRILLPFSNLTTVSVGSLGGFDFDNATVFAMARAWLHVETLCLLVPLRLGHEPPCARHRNSSTPSCRR
jgi:hypothetical protein